MQHITLGDISDLSSSCALTLLEIASKCLYCNTEDDYLDIFKTLNTVFPFDYSTSGLAELDDKKNVIDYELINISYPEEWLQLYKEKHFSGVDVIVKNNFTTYRPQHWDTTYRRTAPSRKFILLASDFNLKHGYTFGAKPFGLYKRASLFSFSGNFKKHDRRLVAMVDRIIPHLHSASSRLIEKRHAENVRNLITSREKDVLSWVKHGKSTWEISIILNISQATVNFHIYNIMRKLDVVNRAQAVAVATHMGLLDID